MTKGLDRKWQDGEHLGGPRWRKVEVGALLAASARGLALGKRLVVGAFHLPRVRSYSSPSGFVPGPGDFFVVWSVLSHWSLSDCPNTVIWKSRG